MRDIALTLFLTLFFSCTSFSFSEAALRITEIMYAPSTTEGEWIEIYNDGTESVDIGKWIINDGTNHTIENSAPIPAGGRIIIADSKTNFSSVYLGISVYSISALSLSDSGDTIILKDSRGVVYDTVSYTTSPSALKNGKSLQLYAGSFYAGTPSPGKETSGSIQSESAAATSTQSSSPSTSTSQTGALTYLTPYRPWPADQYMYTSFGGTKVGVAGGEVSFEGRLISAEKKPVPAADLYWAFGDGGMEKGKNVKHIYKYPGEYYATLTATYGENIAEDMAKVTIIAPNISLSRAEGGSEGFIEIFNETKEVLDLSGWVLEQGGINGLHFSIPKNTKIFGETKVIFPSDITKLTLATTTVALYFPNNKKVAEYNHLFQSSSLEKNIAETLWQTSASESEFSKEEFSSVLEEKPLSQESFLKVVPEKEMSNSEAKEPSTEKEKEENDRESLQPSEPQPAATGGAEKTSVKMLAIYGFLSLLIISFIVLVSFKEKEGDKKNSADEYEIIE
jgi:hypothetical protein